MRSQNLPCWDQGLRGLTQPRRPQGSDTSSYVIQNRTFFRLWGTPLAQPIWRIAAFHFGTTTTKSCNAQQHIGQRGHRRKPSVLLNSCLDPCFQENDELRNSLAFSSRGAPLQGFHRQLEVCWGLWQTPSFRPCVRFRLCLAWLFPSHTWAVRSLRETSCVSSAGLCSKLKKHIWELFIRANAWVPSSSSVSVRILWVAGRGKKIRGASGGLTGFLVSLGCPLQSTAGWVGRGREGWLRDCLLCSDNNSAP